MEHNVINWIWKENINGIIHVIINVSPLTWFIRYIYWNSWLQNNVIINQN